MTGEQAGRDEISGKGKKGRLPTRVSSNVVTNINISKAFIGQMRRGNSSGLRGPSALSNKSKKSRETPIIHESLELGSLAEIISGQT